MPYLQVVLDLDRREPGPAERACFARGALSVTLADAADDPVLEPVPGTTPLWPTLRLTALFTADAGADELVTGLASELGLPRESVRHETLEDRDWEREWLRDFRPMRFGRRLWICPGGQTSPDPDAVVLELDPGLAFGTGTHATTALCLEWLDGASLEGRRVLDFGCGSGVLALAALRLGAASATAIDIDPQALVATRDNAARNGLAERLAILPAAERPGGQWEVVLANILAGPLVDLAADIAAATCPGGRIMLAGMLDEQAKSVAAAYRPWFHIRAFGSRDGWTALTGHKSAE